MKRVFGRITAASAIIFSLAACSSNPDTASVSGNVRVLAPMATSESSSSEYSLKIIELSGLSNLQEMAGRFARFFISPRIVQDHLDGAAPKARFIRNSKGEFIPTSDLSQQMATIYAHMQRLAALDDKMGAHGVNKWPRDIGVAVQVSGGMVNNAFYDGKTDSMLFVPYARADLPIALNGGILAHEHFHSLFYKLVLKDILAQATIRNRKAFLQESQIPEQGDSGGTVTRIDVPEPDPADEEALHNSYHVTLFRGINEGLADFWAWMYTGDGNFIASSLPGEGARRSLDAGELKSLSTTAMIKENVKGILPSDNSAGQMTAYAYLIGTQFSRLMKSFTERVISARDLQTLEGRQQVAGWLVKALPSMRSDFLAVLDSGYYNPTQFIQSLISVVPELKEEECQYLRDVNNSSSENRVRCQQDGSNWKILAE